MSRRPGDTARVLEFALDMGGRLSHVLGEALPDDAKRHLLNAQRELITALVIMYEHQAGARRDAPAGEGRGRRRTTAGSAAARTRRIRVD